MSKIVTLRKFSHTFDIVTKIMRLFFHRNKSVTKFLKLKKSETTFLFVEKVYYFCDHVKSVTAFAQC